MSTDFSEMLAMGCPDLKTNSEGNGNVVEIMGSTRRLSIKQMTATEFSTARAVADAIKAETVTALAKAIEHVEVTPKNIQATKKTLNVALNTSSNKIKSSENTPDSPQDQTIKSLPSMPLARSRITSLPNIMHVNEVVEYDYDNEDVMENEFGLAEKPQLEQQKLTPNENKAEQTTASEADDAIKRSISKSSKGDDTGSDAQNTTDDGDFETADSSMADSIELLRQQRLEGGRSDARARRSQSPSLRPIKRSAAPDRLHSSSISSSGSNSVSVSLSLNTSKNCSRRESDVSNIEEATTSATLVLPTPPVYPLSKTVSAPSFENRRTSLSDIFPGPSPLIAPETTLHTDPKITNVGLTMKEIQEIVDETIDREIPTGKMVHRTKTPPPVGVKLGVNLKKVSPPRSHITVKKNDAPMLGVVLRKVEKKQVQQKSILDDDKPLYQLSIVRSDHKEYKPAPKPKLPAPLQKSATSAEVVKPSPGGILTGPQQGKSAAQVAAQQKHALYQRQQQLAKAQRPQIGVPITIQKIEGDKIIIIKKIIIPKNGKIPEQYLKVRMFCAERFVLVL